MPRSMATPIAPATRKASGHGDEQRPVEEAGEVAADHLLGDEGGVGAEHDQLAMRHVDHAHHAEGDGEADGGEQQHRAEREAEPDVLRLGPHRLRPLDAGDARPWPPRRSRARRRALERRQRRQRVAAAAAGDDRRSRRRGRRRSASVREHRRRRSASVERASHARRRSRAARAASERLELLGVGAAEGLRPRRRGAWPDPGRHQRQRRDRRADRRGAARC